MTRKKWSRPCRNGRKGYRGTDHPCFSKKFNIDSVLNAVISRLPVSPAWFDKDAFTDKNLRFFASEIIREQILENYSEEIPYCCEVEIEQFKEGEERYEISAVIYVMRIPRKESSSAREEAH